MEPDGSTPAATRRDNRPTARAVIAVAVLQLVVLVATMPVWFFQTVFARNACGLRCDEPMLDLAQGIYLVVALLMLLCSAAAFVISWRSGRDLSWVPLAASAGTVVGLIVALRVFDHALG